MNQFKTVFTGQEKRPAKRAVSSQKCVRAGGKHNDLENVGRTGRHHTFFEMLGNFSFGDYFKEEAIKFSWEFVTKELNLPKDCLYVTVYQEDDEAFRIWNKKIGLDPKRIYRFGEKDNFWSMGETGPCGPCSEIFFDLGPDVGCGKTVCDVGCDCDRYVEFWNLVFMEFEQKADGTREKLPKPSIDTGMGLERVTAIVNGATNNYGTDLFAPIFSELERLSSKSYGNGAREDQVSMRVIADHIRAMTFLIADGVHPSNEGRGYVLRRIMRRAMRHGRKLGLNKPFLHELSAVVVKMMGDPYKELKKNALTISAQIKKEELRFAVTIDRGLDLLQEEIKKVEGKLFDGAVAFRLYDTYGFPKDLTADILRDHELTLNEAQFEEAFELHREKARGTWKGSGGKAIDHLVSKWVSSGKKSKFVGYDQLSIAGKVLALVCGGKEVKKAKEGDAIELLSDKSPFYGESGGQVGDIGTITGDGFSLEVIDTKKPTPGLVLHECKVLEGEIAVDTKITLSVDPKARLATAKNHTGTHLLHSALKEVLGAEVSQKGSLVSPERLRFDFTYGKALTSIQLTSIEQKINEQIWKDSPVVHEVMPLKKALACGAVALFDEKYGEKARVVSVSGYSKELCGGTHLARTGEIGLFKFVKEGSVASGIRRVEAYTGHRALRHVAEMEAKMKELSELLGVPMENVGERIKTVLKAQKDLKKKGTAQVTGEATVSEVNGVRLLKMEVADADARGLRDLADRQMEKIKSGVVALGATSGEKAFVVVKVSKDMTGRANASALAQIAAKVLGGSGGGRPDMAQAGGAQIDKLPEALEAIASAI